MDAVKQLNLRKLTTVLTFFVLKWWYNVITAGSSCGQVIFIAIVVFVMVMMIMMMMMMMEHFFPMCRVEIMNRGHWRVSWFLFMWLIDPFTDYMQFPEMLPSGFPLGL